jgi:hypothetical protein
MTTTCSQCLQEFELANLPEAALPHFCGKDCELVALASSDSTQQWFDRLDVEMEEVLALAKRG